MVANLLGIAGAIGIAAGGGKEASAFPYLLASPMVHLVHGNPGRAGGSFLLHAIVPLAATFIGYELAGGACPAGGEDETSGSFTCGLPGAIAGGVVGVVAVTVFDVVLARGSATSPPPHASLIPTFSLAQSGRTTIGVAATF